MSAEAAQGLLLASYAASLERPDDFTGDFGAPMDRADLAVWPSSHLDLLAQFLADERVHMARKRQKYERLASSWLQREPPPEPDPPPQELNWRLLMSPIAVTSLLTQRFGLISLPRRATPRATATTLVAAMVPVGELTSDVPEPMEKKVVDTAAVWYPKLPFERRLAIEMAAIGLDAPRTAEEIETVPTGLKNLIRELNCARMRLHSDIADRMPEIMEHNERCDLIQKVQRMIDGTHTED
jgi:hypothetical protein